ncbi:MAG TPA: hypothetical protein VKR83_02900 [Ktedonobacteraceae bacterium]|nr:hypothetical protein [Ktedonobacteraceae bacterium]
MQAPGQNNNLNYDDLEKKIEQRLELSDAWRQLLGMEAQASPVPVSSEQASAADAGAQEGVLVLSNDPWTHLIHAHGVQVVDLQQAHLHPAQASAGDSDVEHALDFMQENLPEK